MALVFDVGAGFFCGPNPAGTNLVGVVLFVHPDKVTEFNLEIISDPGSRVHLRISLVSYLKPGFFAQHFAVWIWFGNPLCKILYLSCELITRMGNKM